MTQTYVNSEAANSEQFRENALTLLRNLQRLKDEQQTSANRFVQARMVDEAQVWATLATLTEPERVVLETPTSGRMHMNEIPLTQTTREEHKHWTGPSEELVEILGVTDDESIRDAARRVITELAGWKIRAEHAEARVAEAKPVAPPLIEAGNQIRIRTRGADVYTSTTVAAELEYSPAEGFFALVPPGAFAEGRRDEIATESIDALLKALAPAKLSGTILQQVKQLVGTAESRLRRIRDLEESREAFEGSIRILLQAQNESESDDHYCPEQPTLDALVRVLQRLMADESRIDGSMTRDQVLDEIQQGWHEDGHKELKA